MKLDGNQRAILAGVVWIAIGVFLILRGWWHWEAFGDGSFPALPLAIGGIIGVAKGFFVIKKSAARMMTRIRAHPEPQWFWQMYPPYLYLLIPLMILFGWGLRHFFGEDHPGVVLAVFAGIGAALLVSSLPFFRRA
jgi:hypothetical protein